MKKYASARSYPANKFSARNQYRIANRILRALPFELHYAIQRQAGRSLHRARQSLVNAQIRRRLANPLGGLRRVSRFSKVSGDKFYGRKKRKFN